MSDWPSYTGTSEMSELEREKRARGLEQLDMARMEAENERLREARDRYEAAIRWVLARNTSGIVLGGYDKPMVMHLLEALDG